MRAAACSILVFFSWSHSNIGDIGITPGLLRLIGEHIPGAEVTVVANSRADETRQYLQERFPDCKVIATPFAKNELTPEFAEAFSVYARARVIVSMEMHSIILGLAAGTPVVHPRFEEAGRKAWMLRDLGLVDWLLDIDKQPAEEIIEALFDIHNDYDAALARVESAMRIVRKRQAETMAVVKQTLERSGE